MRKKSLILILCVLMGVMGIPITIGATYNYATVESVTGTVSVLKSGGEKAITPTMGTKLTHGDRIITGKGASLSIKIDDDKYIKVGEKTYLSLSELIESAETGSDTNIKLFSGQIFTSITKPLEKEDTFTIETPTAVMGAKGTKFVVKYTLKPSDEAYEGTNEVVVLEGTVALQDEQLKEEDKEILIHRNERSVFTADVLKQLGDAIEKALESGQDVSQISLQDLAVTNGVLDPLDAKELDVFTLEIIKDDPEDIDPQYLEDIDQNIRDKKEEEAKEDELIKEPQKKVDFDPDVSLKTSPKTTSPSSGGTQVETIDILGVVFVDINGDGITDHLRIDFSNAVDDTSINPDRVITQTGDFMTKTNYDTVVETIDGDETNDKHIYFEIDSTESPVNTQPNGMIRFDSGFATGVNDGESRATNELTIRDEVGPKLMSAEVQFDGDSENKYIKFIFSEDIALDANVYDDEDTYVDEIRWHTSETATFSESQVISNNSVDVAVDGKYLKLTKLPVDVVDNLKDLGLVYFKMSDTASVLDLMGNKTILKEQSQEASIANDYKAAKITSYTSTYNEDPLHNDSTINVTIGFSDYLVSESVNMLTTQTNAIFTNTGQKWLTISDITLDNTAWNNISLAFTIHFQGALEEYESITFDYKNLSDFSGQTIEFSNAYESFGTIKWEYINGKLVDLSKPIYADILETKTQDRDMNGKVDTLLLKLCTSIMSPNYAYNAGELITLSNSDMGSLYMETIRPFASDYPDAIPSDADDDAFISLDLNEAELYNTGVTGDLMIDDLQAIYGYNNNQIVKIKAYETGIPIVDGALPSPVGVVYYTTSSVMEIIMSEPLDGSSSIIPSQIELYFEDSDYIEHRMNLADANAIVNGKVIKFELNVEQDMFISDFIEYETMLGLMLPPDANIGDLNNIKTDYNGYLDEFNYVY